MPFKKHLQEAIYQYCLESFTHGLKFIVLPKRNKAERIFWAFTISLCFFAAIFIFALTWTRIHNPPYVITQSDSPHHPIWNYMFPAVTICNYNTVSKEHALNLARVLYKPDDLNVSRMAKLLRYSYYLIDPSTPSDFPNDIFAYVQDIMDRNQLSVFNLLKQLTPSCHKMMVRCTWKGQARPCNELFEMIPTPYGFCCAFNYYAARGHPLSDNLNTSFDLKLPQLPRRVSATGYLTALQTLINCEPHDYYATPFSSYGYRVLVHNPYDYPDGNVNLLLQSTNTLLFTGITPLMYRSERRIANLDVSKRLCMYVEERQLLHQKYSYFNCMGECRANITNDICGCMPYQYFPSKKVFYQQNSRECNFKDISCLSQNKKKIEQKLMGTNFINPDDPVGWMQLSNFCGCMPDCTYTRYEIEGSTINLNRNYVVNKPILYGNIKLTNHSVLRIYFDDLSSIRYTTTLSSYWHTSLGYYGGIVSIFTGLSIVSIIELVYYFTIKQILKYALKLKK